MSLLGRLRSRLSSADREQPPASELADAERLMRLGGSVLDIRQIAETVVTDGPVEAAWQSMFLGDLDSALDSAYRAATERPYDVDSRIVHGTVRLARNELDHAAHEFDAVIEEFGAEPDAADGRRATILARGFAPLDDLPASHKEWESAAVLLTTLWRIADVVRERLDELSDAHPEGRSLIMQALENGLTADSEAGDGSV